MVLICNFCARRCQTVCPRCFYTAFCSAKCIRAQKKDHGEVCETLAVISVNRRFTDLRRMVERELVTPAQQDAELDKIVRLLSHMPTNVHQRMKMIHSSN